MLMRARLRDSPSTGPVLLQARFVGVDNRPMRTSRASLAALAALAAAMAATIGAGPAAAAPPSVGGCQVFPAYAGSAAAPSAADQTAWNQDVSQAPVRGNSASIVNRIQA